MTKIADTLAAAATKSERLRRQNLITEMEAAYNCRPTTTITGAEFSRKARFRLRSRKMLWKQTRFAYIQWKTLKEEMRYDNGHVDQPANADYTLFLRILKLSIVAQIEMWGR